MSSRTDLIVDLIDETLADYDAEQEANAVRALGPVPDTGPPHPIKWVPRFDGI